MIKTIPLDIHGQGLYSSYDFNYPMDSQENLFRYLDQSNHSSNSSVSPLVGKAKNRKYSLNKKCIDCGNLILNFSTKCRSCSMKFHNVWSNSNNSQEIHRENTKKAILKRLYKYENLKINENTHQILLGSLLGDGNLYIRKFSPRYSEAHCMEQKDYSDWKANFFLSNNMKVNKRITKFKKNGSRINYLECVIETE